MPMSLLLASMGDYAATTRGGEFTTHEVTVETREDIVSRTSSGPRPVCVLSGIGVLSSVVIHHRGPSGTTKYVGRFKIVRLTGSYRASGTGSYTSFGTGWDDVPRIDGQLKIALVEGNGTEFFGGVAGVLIAAEPAQIVVGCFRNPYFLQAALSSDYYTSYEEARSRMRRVSNWGRVPGVSNLGRVPCVRNSGRVPGVLISEMTGGDDGDTCTTPSSTTSMEAVHGGADLGGVPGVHISKMTGGGDDTCTTPSSTVTTASLSLSRQLLLHRETGRYGPKLKAISSSVNRVELLLPPNRALNARFATGSRGQVTASSPSASAHVHVPNLPPTELTYNSSFVGHSQLTILVVCNSVPNQQTHPIPITSTVLSPVSPSGVNSNSDLSAALIGNSPLINFQLSFVPSSLMLATVPTINNLQLQFSNKAWPSHPSSPAPTCSLNETTANSSSSMITRPQTLFTPPTATVSPFIEPTSNATLTTYSRNPFLPALVKPPKYPSAPSPRKRFHPYVKQSSSSSQNPRPEPSPPKKPKLDPNPLPLEGVNGDSDVKTEFSWFSWSMEDLNGAVVPEVECPGLGTESGRPVMVVGSGGWSSCPTGWEGAVQKKRGRAGRPRKNKVDGDKVDLSPSMPENLFKRALVGPLDSGRRELSASLGDLAADIAGGNISPHVIVVNPGEDIASRISSFSLGPLGVYILSATGVLSSVVIHQPGPFGGTMKYDGRFEILSLSGSFTFSETGGTRRMNGMLSISLARPNGNVFGGAVVGALIAAEPIQLIVGNFNENISKKIKRRPSAESSTAAGIPCVSDSVRAPSHISYMADGDDNCTTPTSTFLEPPVHGGSDFFALNQNMNPFIPHSFGQVAPQQFRTFPGINPSFSP
ncbi:hypothetical protein FH972_010090 [Carpinus fangiana]|uniref:AT-hook motif nuclear-localized protein n=1 Tax=Carpinus fangiana TaxID=176857 RepID=A0A660KNU7_9ROSI|nr:hypothetical protein FH972_010090 [Carpinus fangiana]